MAQASEPTPRQSDSEVASISAADSLQHMAWVDIGLMAPRKEDVLVVWDVMEDVGLQIEVEAGQQQEENFARELPEVAWPAEAARSLPNLRSPMEELQDIQSQLSSLSSRASREFALLKKKIAQKCRYYFDRRRAIIQAIPGFWAKVIISHPQISAIITDQDEDLLKYMLSLEVEEVNHGKDLRRVVFYFCDNPYFRNSVIRKEYKLSIIGYEESASSEMQWFGECVGEIIASCPQDPKNLTFFDWLTSSKWQGSSRIAEIIIEDLWLNPLQYYFVEDDPRGKYPEHSRNTSFTDEEDQEPSFASFQEY
ncbi:testis-specific Y-encoded protein 1-like [Perognathus longimembris pacificus]|uniref:testis-specific Y-encoded protein 1-like n=1 Tax=Perognathus longimembris pacificus TaxID=214514 RepID=UPI002019690F|nr:testis-specific Y-encoded protein 1-like [Perognathus longimembris pacificus]